MSSFMAMPLTPSRTADVWKAVEATFLRFSQAHSCEPWSCTCHLLQATTLKLPFQKLGSLTGGTFPHVAAATANSTRKFHFGAEMAVFNIREPSGKELMLLKWTPTASAVGQVTQQMFWKKKWKWFVFGDEFTFVLLYSKDLLVVFMVVRLCVCFWISFSAFLLFTVPNCK